jgi:hypothetical protein
MLYKYEHILGHRIEMLNMAAVDGSLGRFGYVMFWAHGDNYDVGERWRIVSFTAETWHCRETFVHGGECSARNLYGETQRGHHFVLLN